MTKDTLRIGIALCGAELAGSAHIGVLSGLERLGIKPNVIAGSSAGALVASMYAHGYSLDDFHEIVSDFPGIFLLDYGFPLFSSLSNQARHRWQGKNIPLPAGLFRGKKLQRYIKRVHQNRLPKMPFYIVATDLYSTNPITFTNEVDAVRQGFAEQSTNLVCEISGSCSIPGLFTPVNHRHWMLVDGGVRDFVPVTILRSAGCNKIIAVNVLKLSRDWYPVTMVDVLYRSLDTLMDESMVSSGLNEDDVFVISPELERTSWWSCREPMMRNIDLGYQYVLNRSSDLSNFLRK